jgi:hypothetical protein
MKILDLSAGWRWIWHDPHHRDTVYLDRRAEVMPDVVADSRRLPFKEGVFGLVVFDPPHVNFGTSTNMARDYGHCTTAEIREIVRDTGMEAHRVCQPNALMALKWNDHDQPQGTILALLAAGWEPLFGHKMGRKNNRSVTRWSMLRRSSQSRSACDVQALGSD